MQKKQNQQNEKTQGKQNQKQKTKSIYSHVKEKKRETCTENFVSFCPYVELLKNINGFHVLFAPHFYNQCLIF